MKNIRVLSYCCFHTTYLHTAAGNTNAQTHNTLIGFTSFLRDSLFNKSYPCLLENKKYSLYCILFKKNNVKYLENAAQCLLYSILFAINATQYKLNSVVYALCSKKYAKNTIQYILYNKLCIKNTEKYTKNAFHFTSIIKHSPDFHKYMWNYLPGGYLTRCHMAYPGFKSFIF